MPNFSEGQSAKNIAYIADSVRKIKNVTLLDIDSGHHVNRTVMTILGQPLAVAEAAFEAIKAASECINMALHTGTHPRIGATDVCPLIPFKNMSMAETIAISKELAQKVAQNLQIPTYLYNESAQNEDRKKLAWLRKGEYENLNTKILQSDFRPDYGNAIFNKKSGICIIGARKILLAYNINLTTKDVTIAKNIASKIRETASDGLPTVRAIGWYISEFDTVQVSCNITDYTQTSIFEVFDKVEKVASQFGTQVSGSELVGMLPLNALIKSNKNDFTLQNAIEYLGLNAVKPFETNTKIIEYSWQNKQIN